MPHLLRKSTRDVQWFSDDRIHVSTSAQLQRRGPASEGKISDLPWLLVIQLSFSKVRMKIIPPSAKLKHAQVHWAASGGG